MNRCQSSNRSGLRPLICPRCEYETCFCTPAASLDPKLLLNANICCSQTVVDLLNKEGGIKDDENSW